MGPQASHLTFPTVYFPSYNADLQLNHLLGPLQLSFFFVFFIHGFDPCAGHLSLAISETGKKDSGGLPRP